MHLYTVPRITYQKSTKIINMEIWEFQISNRVDFCILFLIAYLTALSIQILYCNFSRLGPNMSYFELTIEIIHT